MNKKYAENKKDLEKIVDQMSKSLKRTEYETAGKFSLTLRSK